MFKKCHLLFKFSAEKQIFQSQSKSRCPFSFKITGNHENEDVGD